MPAAAPFALNHMVAPARDHRALFDLALRLGIGLVEIRNDLPGVALADGTAPATVGADARARGLAILSINALQRFNHWTPARAEEARALAAAAAESGAAALVLCPVNDVAWQPDVAERRDHLLRALEGLAPILAEAGIIGLVEPLGFAECSLRLKSEAVAAIEAVGAADRFRLVHDTFHHHVAGERAIYPFSTGLVHISGVEDRQVPVTALRDPHRVLVGPADRIGNIGQIRVLLAGGYRGPLSFEPFAAEVHGLADIAGALAASRDFVLGEIRDAAA